MEPVVFSSSAIKAFKDCRKAYELGYEKWLEPNIQNEPVERGTRFHDLIAGAARGVPIMRHEGQDGMEAVAQAYLDHKGLPDDILRVEEPIYVEIHAGTWVRCTWDLVYRVGDTIMVRDYKTFGKAPTVDLDLDFQGRFYIAAAQKFYGTRKVDFEYEYVRSELYHQKGGQPDMTNPWTPDERYLTYPLIISDREADSIWEESQWVVRDIIRTREEGSWYRSDKKGFGGCPSCFYKHLCKAENQLGRLDEQTTALFSTPRERIVLPDVH